MNKQLADNCLDDFPSNYVGSKRKIMSWLGQILIQHNIINDSTYFLDLFGGSGIVSYYLSCLGLKGEINDLMISSHFNHLAIFDTHNPMMRGEVFDIPLGVEFKEYKYVDIGSSVKQETKVEMDDLFADVAEDEKLVANEAIFESRNNVFNHVYKLLSHYILLHFTAKEAFELACVITNSIMCDEVHVNDNEIDKHVHCFTGDVYQFIEGQTFSRTKPENVIAYIDPPYGGASSNYHKIYSIMECIAFAASEMKWQYIDEINKFEESGADVPSEYISIIDFLAMNHSFDCHHSELYTRDYPHNVDDLPHIKKHGWRFNTTNLLDFKLSFRKMIQLLVKNKIYTWIFSFNSDSSWITEEEFIHMMEEEFNCSVIVERIDYEYAYRTVDTGASKEGMGHMTVGQGAEEVAGKRSRTSEEIVYICTRRKE